MLAQSILSRLGMVHQSNLNGGRRWLAQMSQRPWRPFLMRLIAIFLLMGLLNPQLARADMTFVVNSTGDEGDTLPGDGICVTVAETCTLRAAIEEANATPGTDTIHFNIAGVGPHTIAPTAALPYITGTTIIDGATQPSANCTTWPPTLQIELDGSNAGGSVFGLVLQNPNNTVRGLVINRFSATGIFAFEGGNTFQCNFIGTDPTGTINRGNGNFGIMLNGSTFNLIGGLNPGDGNLLSGNYEGIRVAAADNNTIQGNYIGTNATGTAVIGNVDGILVTGSNNLIGGTVPEARNIISGNGDDGIELFNITAANNTIQGNYIGTNAAGTADLGNAAHGIHITNNAAGTLVGGTDSSMRNIISGNNTYGVMIDSIILEGSSGNVVQGNYIGTNATGTASIPNGDGIFNSGTETLVGGTTGTSFYGACTGACNLLSGNNWAGISLHGTSTNSVVQGNKIGTQADGFTPLPNGINGIFLRDATNVTIGGIDLSARNTVAYNNDVGIAAINGTSGASLRGNAIYENGNLGIDLNYDGLTPNDETDEDTGPNNLQNHPTNIEANIESDTLMVTAEIDSTISNSAYPIAIDFYIADNTPFAQGERYLTTATAETPGTVGFSIVAASEFFIEEGTRLVATATDANGNTSEFSEVAVVMAVAMQTGPTYFVNVTEDTDDGQCTVVHCSLREAVLASEASFGPETIYLPAGTYQMEIPSFEEGPTATMGDFDINDVLTIEGAGANNTSLNANALDRHFEVLPDGTLTIHQLSLLNGNVVGGNGGAIRNGGTLFLENVLLVNNSAVDGGALENVGTAVLRSTTLFANTANEDGGGIRNAGSSLLIENSTLHGNSATANGGAIYNEVPLTLSNATLANNTAGEGAGLYQASGNVAASNTIMADNIATDGLTHNCTSPITDLGHNLQYPSGTCGTGVLTADPLLGTFAYYGGQTPLVPTSVVGPAVDGGNNETCTPTDQRGVPRPMGATCDIGAWEATRGNTAWPTALRLGTEGEPFSSATTMDTLTAEGQSRWYKFQVSPGSVVALHLDNLPANYDLTLFGDIQVAYDALVAPQDLADLTQLTAEFAPDAFAPDAFAPDAFAPDAFAPDAFAPDAFAPDAFAPDAFAPDAFAPDAFAPDAFAPDAFAPDAFAPDAFAPDAFAPDAFAPDAFAPDAFAPAVAFSNAQQRTLITVSALDGTADEVIVVNTWDKATEFYVRVSGRNGSFDPATPFTLTAEQEAGVCETVSSLSVGVANPAPHAADYTSIILTDLPRMGLSAAETADLQARLAAFASRPDVNGVVVDIHSALQALNDQADLAVNVQCAFAKNLVAGGIKSIVDAYRAQNPALHNILIVGSDDVIPFFRHPDRALLANEKNYNPPVREDTPSYATLALGYVLGQDAYGSSTELTLGNTTLPLPDAAVGRLVETYSDIIAMLNSYEAADGQINLPQTALVSGYDFLEDAAVAMGNVLADGLGPQGNVDTSLIMSRTLSPLDPRAWNATQLQAALSSRRNDILYLAGHFSANSALAGDYATRLTTTEVLASSVDLANVLVISPGCHSGYNIVNSHGIPGLTNNLDWAQALAQRGATLVAGTGYQYGDTDFLEYGERLYLNFAQALVADTGGPIELGTALVQAKQVYLANTAELRGIHEKTILQTTLFGFPMLRVNMPVRATAVPEGGFANPLVGYTTNPGQTLGLFSQETAVSYNLQPSTKTLTSVSDNTTLEAVYFTGPDGVVTNPAEPVRPVDFQDVTQSNAVLRGVGFMGGQYTDYPNVAPLTGAPATEVRSVRPPFQSDVFFPMRPWRVNYVDALTNGGQTSLAITPAQFRSTSAGYEGTWRAFDDLNLKLFYSSNVTNYNGNVPALASPLAIDRILATSDAADAITFRARVSGDPAAGVQEVWVTYTFCDEAEVCDGVWQSLFLTQDGVDSTRWSATLALNGTPASHLRYMVQAVNGVGVVTLATNLGRFYTADVDPGQAAPPANPNQSAPAATSLSFEAPPTSAAYSTQTSFTAVLTSNGNPVAGKSIAFAVGSQQRNATTDANGRATVTFSLLATPGSYTARASFGGTPAYLSSAASTPFVVDKQATQLSLGPSAAAVLVGQNTGLTAVLTDAAGNWLREKSAYFVVSDGATVVHVAQAITNFNGQASLGDVPLPAGNYTVVAYFSGQVPMVGGSMLALSDVNYLAAVSSSASLQLSDGGNTAPVAVNDSAATEEEMEVVIAVLANDSDPDNDPLTVVSASTPSHGTAELNPDGTITYTPADEFVGQDSFTYTISDGQSTAEGTVTITVTAEPDELPRCDIFAPGVNVIIGTAGDDVLYGTNGRDVILGLGGNDTIYAGKGDDCVDAGMGDDLIYGGQGHDVLYGRQGHDQLFGEQGNDTLYGGRGADVLYGGQGNDLMYGRAGADELYGEEGNDTLYGGRGADIISGGNGNDILDGDRGQDTLQGDNGSDTLYGGRGADTLNGNNGNDTLNGQLGTDICNGDNGTDTAVNCETTTGIP